MKLYRDILQHSSVYAVGQGLSYLASILLLPIYTHYLRPADYGVISILDLFADILGILIGAGMAVAVNRFHFEARNEHERREVWWTGMTFVILSATLISGSAWILRDELAILSLGSKVEEGSLYFTLILATLWFVIIAQLLNTYLRVRKWSGLYVMINFVRLLINVGLNLYFLIVLDWGVRGILFGNLITEILYTLPLIFRIPTISTG